MHSEPIEIGLAGISSRQSRWRRRTVSPTLAPSKLTRAFAASSLVATDAVDEAFALPENLPTRWTLVRNLSAQLDALDRQREQLAQLLQSIDMNALNASRD